MTRKLFLLSTFSIFINTSSYSQEPTTRQKLVGSWIYYGLEFKAQMNKTDKAESDKADKLNKDLIITFDANGNYVVWNKQTGKSVPYAKGVFSLTNKERHLKIEGLEGDIDKVDGDVLKLSHPERPCMVFKKYNPEKK